MGKTKKLLEETLRPSNLTIKTSYAKDDVITLMIDESWLETKSHTSTGLSYGEIRNLNEYSLR